MAFCTKCGKLIEEGMAFCGSCGVPVAGSAGTPVVPAVASVPGKEDKLKPYWYVIIWCSLLVPFVGGLIIVLLSSVMHYVWRKEFPKKAKAINRQGFGAFFVGIALPLFVWYVGSNFVRMQVRAQESDVKSVAHTVQLAIEDYKTTPGHEGIKPTTVAEFLTTYMPTYVLNKKNPFNGEETYGTGGISDANVSQPAPGRVGYIFAGQNEPYEIIAIGKDGTQILILKEGE